MKYKEATHSLVLSGVVTVYVQSYLQGARWSATGQRGRPRSSVVEVQPEAALGNEAVFLRFEFAWLVHR